jgi:hypothetical protein
MNYSSDLNNEQPSFLPYKPPLLLSSSLLPGKIKFTLDQAKKTQRKSISIAHSFFNLGGREDGSWRIKTNQEINDILKGKKYNWVYQKATIELARPC